MHFNDWKDMITLSEMGKDDGEKEVHMHIYPGNKAIGLHDGNFRGLGSSCVKCLFFLNLCSSVNVFCM